MRAGADAIGLAKSDYGILNEMLVENVIAEMYSSYRWCGGGNYLARANALYLSAGCGTGRRYAAGVSAALRLKWRWRRNLAAACIVTVDDASWASFFIKRAPCVPIRFSSQGATSETTAQWILVRLINLEWEIQVPFAAGDTYAGATCGAGYFNFNDC